MSLKLNRFSPAKEINKRIRYLRKVTGLYDIHSKSFPNQIIQSHVAELLSLMDMAADKLESLSENRMPRSGVIRESKDDSVFLSSVRSKVKRLDRALTY
jgi:hypothetical protein